MLWAQMNPDTPPDRPSYVSLLNELYREYRLLGTVEYELVGEEGPPHLRQFTIRVRLACNEYSATAPTKKEARQLAAKRLYEHLRRNILRATGRFDEVSSDCYRALRLLYLTWPVSATVVNHSGYQPSSRDIIVHKKVHSLFLYSHSPNGGQLSRSA